MRDCSNATMRDQLPDLLNGRLPAEPAVELRAHLEGCTECRQELALLTRVRAQALAPTLDAARIVAALPRYRVQPSWRRAMRSPVVRAAAAVVLLAGGYVALRSTKPDPSAQVAESTQVELAVGDTFQDLTDSDLLAVIDELGELEAMTPDASEDVIPVLEQGGV